MVQTQLFRDITDSCKSVASPESPMVLMKASSSLLSMSLVPTESSSMAKTSPEKSSMSRGSSSLPKSLVSREELSTAKSELLPKKKKSLKSMPRALWEELMPGKPVDNLSPTSKDSKFWPSEEDFPDSYVPSLPNLPRNDSLPYLNPNSGI